MLIARALFVVAASSATPSIAGNVSLDGALQRSELVVTVQLDTPFTTRVSVPVPSGSEGKECAPYEAHVITGKVVKVIHPTKMRFTVVSEEARLVVFPGNIDQAVELARVACVDGTSKNASVDSFRGVELTDGATRTVLLRWLNGFGWTEAVQGSWLENPPSKGKLAAVHRMRFVEDPAKNDALCVTAADCVQDDYSCEPCGPCVEHPPAPSAAINRYIALCHEAKKPKPGSCGSCGDVKDELGPPMRPACREMRCVLEPVKPHVSRPAPSSPTSP